MTSPEDARAEATRRGHTLGQWRHIVGDGNQITSCVCPCGAWLIDLGGGHSGGNATRHDCDSAAARRRVADLGEEIGFGHVMHLAQQAWRASLVSCGYPPGGELTVGPCRTLTVPCGCEGACDWCGGCGWLTRRGKQAKESG
jgi:hypothetical protein